MTDQDAPRTSLGQSRPAISKIAGLDTYTWRARIAPAILACLPALTLAVIALPLLENAQKVWSLASVAVTTFAALVARRAGNRVQPELIESWDGLPTTTRLRFRSQTSRQEVARRHAQLNRVLGNTTLPSPEQELADPAAADLVYADAMRRVVAVVRCDPGYPWVNLENRNYGYARNMLGLKRLGQCCAAVTLVLAAVIGGVVAVANSVESASLLVLPGLVSVAALLLWPLVDHDFVRPSAEAYADRVVEAFDQLPPVAS